MSIWGRLGRRVRHFVERFTESSPEPEPRREPSPREVFTRTGPATTPSTSELPPGWVLVGLYHHGEKTTRIDATDDTGATDSDIQSADAQIVWYQPAGADGYKWVHGATGWRSLADQIERTVMVVSNPA